MIVLNGHEYTIQDPDEAALACTEYCNNYFREKDIRDSDGNILSIEPNITNPLFMLMMGTGYLTATLQKMIYSAAAGISISESADRQLLNLAKLAKMPRKAATKTTIVATIYGLAPGPDATVCHITKDLTATVNVGNTPVVFSPAYETDVGIGANVTMVLIAHTYGSYSIPANTITKFDAPVPGFRTMITEDSVPGQDEETIPALRTRMNELSVARTQIDSAAEAIQRLDGVTMCNVYFNYSTTDELTVSNIRVPPRQALIIVQGYNDNIANAFYNNMLCLTAGAGSQRAIRQDYTTHSQQIIPVYFIPPSNLEIYVRIYVSITLSTEQQQSLKDAISTLARTQKIGQSITAGMLIRACAEYAPSIAVNDIEISKEEASGYTYIVTPLPDELIIFNTQNMRVM